MRRPTFNRTLLCDISDSSDDRISREIRVNDKLDKNSSVETLKETNVVQPRDIQRRNVHSNAHPGGNFISEPKKIDTNASPETRLRENGFLRWKELPVKKMKKQRSAM